MGLRARHLAALAAILAAAACGERSGPAAAELPEGALLSARREDLARVLERLARLRDTPLGQRAAEWASRLPDCSELEARTPDADLDALLATLHCAEPDGPLATLHGQRGDGSLALRWPLADGGRLAAELSLDPEGNGSLALRVPRTAARGTRRLLLPASAPPGPGVLSGAGVLVHARVRPEGGLDLASLVPEGGQADQMFRLKSELFAGAILDGTWELAIYVPEPDARAPGAALALGFSHRATAVAAVEAFVAELRERWPVHRSPFTHGRAEGACLLDLRILPELAPCYVATERALVLGWNRASIRKALDGASAELGEAGGLRVDLSRFGEANARLSRAAGLSVPAAGRPPWARVRARARTERDAVHVDVRLEAEREA